MKQFLLLGALLPTFAFADVVVLSTTPRYVTIYQKQCVVRDVFVDNTATSGIVGGVIGGVLGHQVGNGSGKTAATIAGAIIGSNVAKNNAQSRIVQKEFCEEVPIQVQRGETVTFEYNGRLFRHTFED
jgi:uncharacterized protein YcfJ